MVSFKTIGTTNSLITDATSPRSAVFVGGTSGVGKFTIRALVSTGVAVRIYLIGRKTSEEAMNSFRQDMSHVNTRADIIWVEGEVSLLTEVKRICDFIKSKEETIDLLFLTAGYAPFGTRKETTEGIEIAGSLEYYSRMLFASQLLPLLNASANPRVISVLAGGKEQASIDLDDLNLQKPGNFSGYKAQVLYATMNTTTLERMANENPRITFIHSFPGWVDTGNMHRGPDPGSISALLFRVLNPVIALFCFSDEESGQRYLFQCTSAAFGGHGTCWTGAASVNSKIETGKGLFLVDHKCESSANAKVMVGLRKDAQEKIWSYTWEILGPFM